MAPSRKKECDKIAWAWADKCNPLDITEENIRTAYRINLPRCKLGSCRRNCKGNPYCLSALGEHRWVSGNNENYNNDRYQDPEHERRKPGFFVGLKNLGATCYVNSLLQLWFHNINFRKAIFMWDPMQDPDERQNVTIQEDKYIPLSVLGHLQSVFALMQHSSKRYVDPTDFISSLRLDTSIQQDAQEFSKLFLSKLETILSYQLSKEVRDFIKDNFCGEYSYVTRCMKCLMESKHPSNFYELDLNIKGETIQDCLKEFMNVEILEGDDKYFCGVCGMKQDAQRFISLTELPPVLNLQLMRFVFDKNTGNRKKLTTDIQFSEKLDMSEFCPNADINLEYTLSAVLVHGGHSANSGHYVAQIRDSENGTWYKFNDECVEKIEGKKFKMGGENDSEGKSKRRAATKNGYPLNAYMLVYTRNDMVSTPSSHEWKLPTHLQRFVEDQNIQFENWVVDIMMNNDATVGKNLNKQVEMATTITMMQVDSDSEDFDSVPESWIKNWLVNPDPDLDIAINNEKFTCQHDKLDPTKVDNVKYINSEIADKFFDKYGGKPRLRSHEFECEKCVFRECYRERVKNKTYNESKQINNKFKKMSNELTKGFWVGKSSFKSWRRLALENVENGILDECCNEILNDVNLGNKNNCNKSENSDQNDENGKHNDDSRISAFNGNENKDSSDESSQITADAHTEEENCFSNSATNTKLHGSHNILKEINNKSVANNVNNAKFTYGDAFCQFLVNRMDTGNTNENANTINDNDRIPNFQTNDSSSTDTSDIIVAQSIENSTKSCVIDTLKYVNGENKITNCNNSELNQEENEDSSSNSEIRFNEDLLCQHGKLCVEENNRRLVPEEVWQILKKYFPNANEFPSIIQTCSLCKSIASEYEVAKDMYKTGAFNQKELLLDLFKHRNRPQLKTDKMEIGNRFYIINKEFYNLWFKFIKEAGKKEPPYSIKNRELLCQEHSGFLYNLNTETPNSLVLVTGVEWQHLSDMYNADCEISVQYSEDGSIVTSPNVCLPCMTSRMETEEKAQLCYSKAKIYIKYEEAESTSNDEAVLPAKRVKLEKSNTTSNNSNSINTNNHCNNNNNCASYNNDNDNSIKTQCSVDNSNNDNLDSDTNIMENNSISDNLSNHICNNNTDDGLHQINDLNDNGNNVNHVTNANGNINGNDGYISENGKCNMSSIIGCNNVNGSSDAVRRSSRYRKNVRGMKEILVSSDLTLLDLKKKICDWKHVLPIDQHLSTTDGRSLTENCATLAEMSIYPETILHLKVDKPCDGVISDDFIVSKEEGFAGTVLVDSQVQWKGETIVENKL